jgi:hypothetical protein
MDPSGQRPAEDSADFFRRPEVENFEDAYFTVLPARAKVLGTIFEGGMLVPEAQRVLSDHPPRRLP